MKDAISHFDKNTLTYTYSNIGWSFTNLFDGNLRITELEKRGLKSIKDPQEIGNEIEFSGGKQAVEILKSKQYELDKLEMPSKSTSK